MKILFIRFSSLGDVILTLPAVNLIKKLIPNADITFLTSSEYQELINYSNDVKTIISVDKLSKKIEIIQNNQNITDNYNLTNFDIIFDLHQNARSYKWHSSGELVFNSSQERLKKRLIFLSSTLSKTLSNKIHVEPVWKRHLKTIFRAYEKISTNTTRSTANSLDFFVHDYKHNFKNFFFDSEEISAFNKKIFTHKKEFYEKHLVSILIGSKWENKKWISNYYHGLAKLLIENNCIPIFIGNSIDKKFILELYEKNMKKSMVCINNFKNIIKLISISKVAIGQDSGLTHLAEACATPVIGLFGPTTPAYGFAPRLALSKTLYTNTACSPCTINGSNSCRNKTNLCMKNIKPIDVLVILKEFLDQ